jgi:serine/threonine-protein kinase RsbW
MPKGSTKIPKLIIPSSQKHLKKAVEFIEAMAQKIGFDEDATADIAISVSEAVNNAILHGNKKDEKKKVTILADPGEKQITIRIRDEGAAFCLDDVCNPLAPENLMKCNGRGILILRTLMDEVTFNSAPGGGMEVKMTKRLRKARGAAKTKRPSGHRSL